jgi:hypothetical protein
MDSDGSECACSGVFYGVIVIGLSGFWSKLSAYDFS